MKRIAALLLPCLLLALPLALPPGPRAQEAGAPEVDEGGNEGVSGDVATIVGARPLVALASEATGGSISRPRQAPFLATNGSRLVLGNLVWEPAAGDRIELREVAAAGAPLSAARLVADAPAEILRPVAAFDRAGRLWLAWTGLVDGRAQLLATREEGDALLPPRALTTGPQPNLAPVLASAADGRIWIAWESEVAAPAGDGGHAVFVAPLADELTLGTPLTVAGAGTTTAVDVALAASGDALWLAWSEWRRDDHDVIARRLDPIAGTLDPAIVISDDPRSDDRHPAIVCAGDGRPWIAWDRVEIASRGESGPRRVNVRPSDGLISVQVRVACLADGAVAVPQSVVAGLPDGMVDGAPSLTTGGGAPQLAFDRDGHLWIAYRYLEPREGQRRYGFPVLLQQLSAAGWSAPQSVVESVGNCEEPALAAAPSGGVIAAFARDERATLTARERREPSTRLVAPLVGRGITSSRWNGLDSIGLARAAIDAKATLPPLVKPAARPAAPERASPNDLDDPYVTGAARFEVTHGERLYQVWWGDLHRHSNISRCSVGLEPGPSDRFVQARDVHRCDFFALTDHSGAIAPSDWWLIDKLNWFHGSARFVTLSAFEWSTQEYGHHNVILPERLALMVSPDSSLSSLYKNVKRGGAITIPHHSADRAFPNDFGAVDDGLTRLVEVYQACRGNYEFDGSFRQAGTAGALGSFVQDALQAGRQFGLIASTDHRNGQSYACVLAPELTRAALFEAMAARRTYGATAKGLFIDLRVGGALMGETIERGGSLPIELTVRGTQELVDVVLFRDGKVLESLRDPERTTMLGNALTPLRLVARFTPQRGPAADDWTLAVDSAAGAFATIVPAPLPNARRRGVPRPEWAARGARAELRVPAGWQSGRHPAFTVHLTAAAGETLRLRPGDAEPITTTVGELLRAPQRFSVPGLADVELAIEPGDAVVDLARTLGVKELKREWSDDSPRNQAAWYYARFIQADGEMAWSSPVFVLPPK